MRFGIFAVTAGATPAWQRTAHYEPTCSDGITYKARIKVSSLAVTKVVILSFAKRGADALGRVCVRYLKPCKNTKCPQKITCSHKKLFFEIEFDGSAQEDITHQIKEALRAEDNRSCDALQTVLSKDVHHGLLMDSRTQQLRPLAHWMRCFSLEQPQGVSPVMLSGLPMTDAIDPQLVYKALPQALNVVTTIAPQLRVASTPDAIGLCFVMMLRVFAGQYATETKDDRSLIKGMLAMNAGWDCDDMSLMSVAVLNAMQRIRQTPSDPILRAVLNFARNKVLGAYIVHGLALTPQKRKEGHVWVCFQFAPLGPRKSVSASGNDVFDLSGAFLYGEATCFSALNDAQFKFAEAPVSFDTPSAMKANRHKGLSEYGECGVNPPISGSRYTGVQFIGHDRVFVARTRHDDGTCTLGATAADVANPNCQTELVAVKYAPLPASQDAATAVRETIMGYDANLFGATRSDSNAALLDCINETMPDCQDATLPNGTIDAPWCAVGQPEKICASVQWLLRPREMSRHTYDACAHALH